MSDGQNHSPPTQPITIILRSYYIKKGLKIIAEEGMRCYGDEDDLAVFNVVGDTFQTLPDSHHYFLVLGYSEQIL
jgi:hypothetical protein